MRTVLNGPLPQEVEDYLDRRRALGHDRHDEVWNGEYHMNPAPNARHARTVARVLALVLERSDERGLFATADINVGLHRHNFRCPDAAVLDHPSDEVWVPSAMLVVEVLSPDDESLLKFDHYAEHGVQEVWIVDPYVPSVEIHACDDDRRFTIVDRSDVLDIAAADITDHLG